MKPIRTMNENVGTGRRRQRTAAAIIATPALALLVAACGGSSPSTGAGGSPSTGGSANSASAVSFANCMRSHGLPNYPDPGSNGVLPKTSAQQLGVSSSVFQAGTTACQHLLPNTGGSLTASSLQQCYLTDVCPQALVQQALSAGREFAECVRSHGMPSWPDPTVNSQGHPFFNITVPRPAPPQDSSAISQCERLQPAGSLLQWF
jgi:hypothetical protein